MKHTHLLLACSLLTLSCEKDLVRGDGPVLSEDRETPAFEKISSDGSTTVYVSYADTFSVKVKAYANLLPHFRTEVREGTLRLGFTDNVRVRNDNTEVYLTLPSISELRMNGSGKARISGAFPLLPALALEINGSGDIHAEGGEARELKVNISGSGPVNLEGFPAEEAAVSISGSGDVRVSVSKKLDVQISGSGAVYYKGDPQVSSRISGSGKVEKL